MEWDSQLGKIANNVVVFLSAEQTASSLFFSFSTKTTYRSVNTGCSNSCAGIPQCCIMLLNLASYIIVSCLFHSIQSL